MVNLIMNENNGIRKEFVEKFNNELAPMFQDMSMQELELLKNAVQHELQHRFISKMVDFGQRLIGEQTGHVDCGEIPLSEMKDCKLRFNLTTDMVMNSVVEEMMRQKKTSMKKIFSTRHTFMGQFTKITIVDSIDLRGAHLDELENGTVVEVGEIYQQRFQEVILSDGRRGYVDPKVVRFEDV